MACSNRMVHKHHAPLQLTVLFENAIINIHHILEDSLSLRVDGNRRVGDETCPAKQLCYRTKEHLIAQAARPILRIP